VGLWTARTGARLWKKHRVRDACADQPVRRAQVDAASSIELVPSSGVTLHLVRHGRTRYNDDGLIQGWADSPITDDGMVGVRAAAEHLRGSMFDAAYSSSSARAVTTAETILAHHPAVPLVVRDELRELHFGQYEARAASDLLGVVEWTDMLRTVLDGTFAGLPGGESGRTYLDRVTSAFAEIESAHRPGDHVLVVTHGLTLMTYLASANGLPDVLPENASVSVVEVRDGSRRVLSTGLEPCRARV
jgi:probable phosphoglycerate mutase